MLIPNYFAYVCSKYYFAYVCSKYYFAYVCSKYFAIALLSNIAIPVFGSSMYGAWNIPLLSKSSWRFGDPRPLDFIK